MYIFYCNCVRHWSGNTFLWPFSVNIHWRSHLKQDFFIYLIFFLNLVYIYIYIDVYIDRLFQMCSIQIDLGTCLMSFAYIKTLDNVHNASPPVIE